MYMTLSWTHDLAEHMTTGGAQSGSVTDIYLYDPSNNPCFSQGLESWAPQWRAEADRGGGWVCPKDEGQGKEQLIKRGLVNLCTCITRLEWTHHEDFHANLRHLINLLNTHYNPGVSVPDSSLTKCLGL